MEIYAGIDPVSGTRLHLNETVPAGPRAAEEAERVRVRLLGQLDGNKQPKTRATVDQLLDRYLEVLDVEPTTRSRYESILDLQSARSWVEDPPAAACRARRDDGRPAARRARVSDHQSHR